MDAVSAFLPIVNPALRGMYPDPSWMWDEVRGETVLVNSSFELVPGLPIHATRDFATWTHVGDAVDADMAHRLLIDGVEDSGGLYAPTIRRIHGRYVIVCTVARVNEGKALDAGCRLDDIKHCETAQGNFVITADDLAGPWRGPYWVEGAEGIDPDVFEDMDGTVWWTQTRPALDPQWEGQTEIWTQPIDPESWALCGHKTVIWRGYGMNAVWAEGPHLYHIGDYVYLMTAEGGTSFEHSEMIMRVFAPNGLKTALVDFERDCATRGVLIEPAREGETSVVGRYDRLFEACKRNPILTHRHLGFDEPVQCVGHADLMHHPDAGWMLTCLGVREIKGGEPGELYSYLGRETFVAPVRWEHNPVSWKLEGTGAPVKSGESEGDPGWPVVAPGMGRLTVPEESSPNAGMGAEVIFADDDRLVQVRGLEGYRFMRVDALDYTAVAPHGATMRLHQDSKHFVTLTANGGQAIIEIADHDGITCRSLDGVGDSELVGLRLRGNRWEAFAIDAGQTTYDDVELVVHIDPLVSSARVLDGGDARFLSTEWAGGFVGCLVGTSASASDIRSKRIPHSKEMP